MPNIPATSHVHVRQLEVGDFSFVRELAARQPNFTVPPPYVLWLLLRIKDAVCLVAERGTEGPLAYLLAVPMEAPSKAMYVWQLAATDRGGRLHAPMVLLHQLYGIARQLRISAIGFSAVPGSAEYRAIRQCVWEISATKPETVGVLPTLVSQNEIEYRVQLTYE
jgi:hypothetical protein